MTDTPALRSLCLPQKAACLGSEYSQVGIEVEFKQLAIHTKAKIVAGGFDMSGNLQSMDAAASHPASCREAWRAAYRTESAGPRLWLCIFPAQLASHRRTPRTRASVTSNRQCVNVADPCGCCTKTEPRQLLKPMSGVLKPASLHLLLGKPGSGKTTFMRQVAGRFSPKHTGIETRIEGQVLLNGRDVEVRRRKGEEEGKRGRERGRAGWEGGREGRREGFPLSWRIEPRPEKTRESPSDPFAWPRNTNCLCDASAIHCIESHGRLATSQCRGWWRTQTSGTRTIPR